MLSHHEIATLILVKDAQDPRELDPADLDTLLGHEFVALKNVLQAKHALESPIVGTPF